MSIPIVLPVQGHVELNSVLRNEPGLCLKKSSGPSSGVFATMDVRNWVRLERFQARGWTSACEESRQNGHCGEITEGEALAKSPSSVSCVSEVLINKYFSTT